MVDYTMVNCDDKDSVRKFYNFYQKLLLDSYVFEYLDSYQNFIQRLKEDDLYNAVVLYGEDELGGAIFEYDEKSNLGIIHYLVVKDNNDDLNKTILNLINSCVKELASNYYEETPNVVSMNPKKKNESSEFDIVHKDEYFLKKILLPSINKMVKK
ncbi:MAG: hypothetical protein IKG40_02425 [Bacilli bacterium]|nr:hypothetical protein [Bacilli bacterium]